MRPWQKLDVTKCTSFGDLLRQAEKLNGITDGQLNKATGIPIENLREYKKDQRLIGVDNARKFAEILRLSEEDLLWRAAQDDRDYRSPR